MHGIYLYLQPAFLVVLVLATAAALYMGIFKAHRKGAGAKALWGTASGVLSAAVWAFFYSHQYMGW
ncbi:hypothetical protein [Desulfocurvus sp. DL9XJH121]